MYAHESPGVPPSNIWVWDDVATNKEGKNEIVDLFDGTSVYDTPKPVVLIKRMLEMSVDPDEPAIVLDFFAGSGTTGQAVFKFNAEKDANVRWLEIKIPEAI